MQKIKGNENECVKIAKAFWEIGEIADDMDTKLDMSSDFLFPMAINYSFACELYLKALSLHMESSCRRTHNLFELYNALDAYTKDLLARNYEKNEQNGYQKHFKDLREMLKVHQNIFIDFRYAYEEKMKGESIAIYIEDMRNLLEVLDDTYQQYNDSQDK